jgi:hypothetical protein
MLWMENRYGYFFFCRYGIIMNKKIIDWQAKLVRESIWDLHEVGGLEFHCGLGHMSQICGHFCCVDMASENRHKSKGKYSLLFFSPIQSDRQVYERCNLSREC